MATLPDGTTIMSSEPVPMLYDSFEVIGNVDGNRWTTSKSSDSMINVLSSGVLSFSWFPFDTQQYAAVSSLASFAPEGNFQSFNFDLQIEASVMTGLPRFWGKGNIPAGPSASNLVSNGVGFSIDTNGNMAAVVYSAGSVVFTSVVTRPVDGYFHKYSIVLNDSSVFWYIDDMTNAVASLSPDSTNILGAAKLPVYMISTAGLMVSGNPVFAFKEVSVMVNDSLALRIADPVYSNRRVSVDRSNALVATSPGAAAVGNFPQSPAIFQITPGLSYGDNVVGTVTTTSTTAAIVRQSAYVEPASAQSTLQTISTSTQDSSGGTGVSQVLIVYIGNDGKRYTVIAYMNGTSIFTINLNVPFVHLDKMVSLYSSGTGTNAGAISLRDGAGNVIATMSAGTNHWNSASHFVERGKVCYVTAMRVSSNGNSGYCVLNNNTVNGITLPLTERIRVMNAQATQVIKFETPIAVAASPTAVAGTEIHATFQSDSSTSNQIWVAFDYYEV